MASDSFLHLTYGDIFSTYLAYWNLHVFEYVIMAWYVCPFSLYYNLNVVHFVDTTGRDVVMSKLIWIKYWVGGFLNTLSLRVIKLGDLNFEKQLTAISEQSLINYWKTLLPKKIVYFV